MLGMMLISLGAVLLLGAGATVAKAYINTQQQVTNDAFLPVAWHNMPADQFFPDHFGVVGDTPAWARQGIDEASECDGRGVEPRLADAMNNYGCTAFVRATYVDTTETLVATVAVIVLGTPDDAQLLFEEFDPGADHPGHLVRAYPVANTPAAEWSDEGRGGVAIGTVDSFTDDLPYVVSVAVGYVDGRSVGVLPEPWTFPAPGSRNEQSLDTEADRISGRYQEQLNLTIKEMAQ
jgi:hypothetical protein